MQRHTIGLSLIFFSFISILIFLLNQSPISQSVAYHNFSDTKEFFHIPNLLNVFSNFPFLIVGLLGIYKLLFNKSLSILHENKFAYLALFTGTGLVFFGSSYYHLWPNNFTLVWDRLPMTIAFMGLFSIVISEYISIKIGKLLLIPLIIIGLSSVYYWYITESSGQGDLRFYAIVQFFPILAIPIILLTFKSIYNSSSAYWWLLAAYILAKFLEYFDKEIHTHLLIISGHSLKHIAAAVGVYILLISYEHRKIHRH